MTRPRFLTMISAAALVAFMSGGLGDAVAKSKPKPHVYTAAEKKKIMEKLYVICRKKYGPSATVFSVEWTYVRFTCAIRGH